MALSVDQVFRDFNAPNVPGSGDYEPVKAEIRALLKQIQNSGGQSVTRNTLAALNAVTPPNENYMGIVINDPNPANNGYYSRVGSAWVFGRGFPDTFARVMLTGSGNAQVGGVSAGVNPADIEVFYASVVTPNTGPMTLTINGPARPVVNLAGNPLSAGEWTGMVMFYLNDDGQYQLLIDAGAAESAAASASSAEADRILAEAAALAAAAALSGIEATAFATLAAASAYEPVVAPLYIRLEGYWVVGFGGGIYSKAITEPGHAGKFSITLDDGVTVAWYELAERIPNTAMFGAKCDGVTIDDTAINAMVGYVKATLCDEFVFSSGYHAVNFIEIERLNGHKIRFDGWLMGVSSDAHPAVFRLKNSHACEIHDPRVVAGKRLNYACGMLFDTDLANGHASGFSGCSKHNIYNPFSSNVRKAIQFGNDAYPDGLYSENVIVGGKNYEVQQGVDVIGSQAFVSIIGMQNICGSTSGAAGWLAIEPWAVRSKGSVVNSGKNEHLLTSRTDGAIFVMEPVASVAYSNPYGQIYSIDDSIETASPMRKLRNPAALASPDSKQSRFQVQGHHGYNSQDLEEFIQTLVVNYVGTTWIGPGNIYGPVAKTKQVVYSNSPGEQIYLDDMAFGNGFKKGLGAVFGGVLHFSKRDIMLMFNANDQVLASNVEAKVGFISRAGGDDYDRMYGNFAAGVFTAPQALKDVEVSYCMQVTPFNYDCSFYVLAGGDVFPISGKSNQATMCGGTVKIGNLAQGATIQLMAVSSGGATTILTYDKMIVSARY